MPKRNERKSVKRAAPSQGHLQDLVTRCMVFVDRNGRVLDKGSHPFSAWLEMEYAGAGFKIRMRAQNSPHSNGSCSIKVRQGKKVLLDAEGSYITGPYDIKAKTYVAGTWERKFPAAPTQRR